MRADYRAVLDACALIPHGGGAQALSAAMVAGDRGRGDAELIAKWGMAIEEAHLLRDIELTKRFDLP